MSDSLRPHRQQPSKLCCPWGSPGKNTEVGCHFLLQCIKVKSESEVTQSSLTLRDPMDCSPPCSSIHGIFQARVLERGAIAFSSISTLLKFKKKKKQTWSVQFSRSVMSTSLRPHGLHQARLPCPSPTPRAYSNPCPLSRWCHPTIPSSVIPFSSRLRSFPASGSFQMSQFFASAGQSIGVSTSTSVLPMNIQDCFPSELTVWSQD